MSQSDSQPSTKSIDLTPEQIHQLENEPSEGTRKNPILLPKEDGSGYELAPRMREKYIPKVKLQFALELANRGRFSAAEDTLACHTLRLKHAECPYRHEVYTSHAHCDLTFCDDCGWGKNRAYWFLRRRPELEDSIVDSEAIMYTFWIDHQEKPKDGEAMLARQRHLHAALWRYFAPLYDTIRGKNFFAVVGDVLDMTSTRACVRVLYFGPRFSYEWIRKNWQLAAGGTWAMFKAESGPAEDLLEKTLNGTSKCLALPGETRAALQHAFRGYRTIRTKGHWAWLATEHQAGQARDGHRVEWHDGHILGECSKCNARLIRIPKSVGWTLTELFKDYGDVITGTGKAKRFIPKENLLVDKSESILSDASPWASETGPPSASPPS